MAINRHKKHLVVYMEDKPYRELVNGAKMLINVNENVIADKTPCGGWKKVFAQLEENLSLLNNKVYMHALLLMDFDNKFEQRKENFDKILLNQTCSKRVFLLGINNKESEDLKKHLKCTDNEKISEVLLGTCPKTECAAWQSEHLACNSAEISRMKGQGVFDWLFIKNRNADYLRLERG